MKKLMLLKKLSNYFLFLVIILTIVSCKSREIPLQNEDNQDLINIKSNSNDTLDFLRYREFYKDSNSQHFVFQSNLKETVIGAKGTKIKIPKDCFFNYSGTVGLKLIEVYNLFDMIMLNLTTRDNHFNLLESGGMIFLEFSDTTGAKLSLSKSIEIEFARNKDTKMDLYINHNDEYSNWEVVANSKTKQNQIENTRILVGYIQKSIIDENGQYISLGDSIPYYEDTMIIRETYSFLSELMNPVWYNCDKVLSTIESIKDFSISLYDVSNVEEYTYFLIFKTKNTIISPLIIKNNMLHFGQIPRNVSAYFLMIKYENKQFEYYIDAMQIMESHAEIKGLNFNVSTLEEMKIHMQNLGINRFVW